MNFEPTACIKSLLLIHNSLTLSLFFKVTNYHDHQQREMPLKYIKLRLLYLFLKQILIYSFHIYFHC